MHKPITTSLFAIALLASAVAGADTKDSAKGFSNDTVKIGVLADMSGIFSDLSGEGAVTAARMAVDDFVAEQKPGFKVEVVTADHQNKTDVAASRAREWYDTEGVDMITDVINSAVALAVSEVTRDKDRVLMVTGAGSTTINNEQCSPNTILYAWDTYSLANSLGRTITEQGDESWYFVTVDYALGKYIEYDATKAVENAGGEVLGSLHHPMGASDFASFMPQAQSSGADVIGIANAGGDLHNAVRVANEFGINQSGCKMVFADGKLLKVLANIASKLTSCKHVMVFKKEDMDGPSVAKLKEAGIEVTALADVEQAGAEKPQDASKALSVEALAAKKDAEREAMYLAAGGATKKWQMKFDEEKGEKYWENTETGEISMTEPPEEEQKSAAELQHEKMKAKLAKKKKR